MNKLNIFTDGGARGNPGPAAIGVLVKAETGPVLVKISRKIGVTTNNVAEYSAVVEALEWLIKNKEIISRSSGISQLDRGSSTLSGHDAVRLTNSSTASEQSTNHPTNKNNNQEIHFHLDSTLVVNQLNGLFKIKNGKLQELLFKIKQLEQDVNTPIYYSYIPREKITVADQLVNQALDNV